MRDTLRLRRHLALLACLPAGLNLCAPGALGAAGLAGCGNSGADVGRGGPRAANAAGKEPASTPAAVAERDAPDDAEGSAVKKTGHQRALDKARGGPIINEAPDGPDDEDLSPKERRMQPIAGDPPWIDGYNPEEDPCPSGNWCGTIETAMAIAPDPANPDGVKMEMDCPSRIVGSHADSPILSQRAKYRGLSDNKAMQGSLNEHGTELARADGQADACCYHWFEYCSGRPLFAQGGLAQDEDAPRRAEASTAGGWTGPADEAWTADEPAGDCSAARLCRASARRRRPGGPAGDRSVLAQAWIADALDEHASVAAFARATLELMAVGAPPALLEGCARAMIDEVDHARRCFALAERFGAVSPAPGPLPALPPRPGDLAAVAANTFVEGCVGETIAALVAARAAAHTTDPTTAATLEVIAADEARHAALAWRTVRWAVRTGDARVVTALRDAAATLGRAATRATADRHGADDLGRPAWGRLGADDRRATARDAWADIVDPMLAEILGDAAAAVTHPGLA